jgi:hypothetical protein
MSDDSATNVQLPKRMGRPPLPAGERKANRSVRLSDEHWAKLRALGVDWLERAIDRAKLPD